MLQIVGVSTICKLYHCVLPIGSQREYLENVEHSPHPVNGAFTLCVSSKLSVTHPFPFPVADALSELFCNFLYFFLLLIVWQDHLIQ